MFRPPGDAALDDNERVVAEHRARVRAGTDGPALISDDTISKMTRTGLLSMITRESMRAQSSVDCGMEGDALAIMQKVMLATKCFLNHRNTLGGEGEAEQKHEPQVTTTGSGTKEDPIDVAEVLAAAGDALEATRSALEEGKVSGEGVTIAAAAANSTAEVPPSGPATAAAQEQKDKTPAEAPPSGPAATTTQAPKGKTPVDKALPSLGSWFPQGPSTIYDPTDLFGESTTIEGLLEQAAIVRDKAKAELDHLWQKNIQATLVPTGDRHPAQHFTTAVQPSIVGLSVRPETEAEAWRAERFSMYLLNSLCCATRYASVEGEELIQTENKFLITILQSLDGHGVRFCEDIRSLLVLAQLHCIKKNRQWKLRPILMVAFCEKYIFANAAVPQLAFLWLRCEIILAIAPESPQRDELIKALCSKWPIYHVFRPELKKLFDLCPMPKEQFQGYASQLDGVWQFKKADRHHERIVKVTGNVAGWCPITNAQERFPAQFHSVTNSTKQQAQAPTRKQLENTESAYNVDSSGAQPSSSSSSKPAAPHSILKSTVKTPAPAPETPKPQRGRKQVQKTPAAEKKDKQDHGRAVSAAGKGFAPVQTGAGKSAGVFYKDMPTAHGDEYAMSNIFRTGAPATSNILHSSLAPSRAFRGMRVYGGAQCHENDATSSRNNANSDDEDGSSSASGSEDESSGEKRAGDLERGRDKLAREKELTRQYLHEQQELADLREELVMLNQSGNSSFAPHIFGISTTYQQPCPVSDPKDLETDTAARITARRAKKDGSSDAIKVTTELNLHQYYEVPKPGSHLTRARTSQRVPFDIWPQVLTCQADHKTVLNPLLFRNVRKTILDYMDARDEEQLEVSDFTTPKIDSPMLRAFSLRSTVQWFLDEIAEGNLIAASERATTIAMNGHTYQKYFEKASDKVIMGEKAPFEKSSASYPLGCLVLKEDCSDTWDDWLVRAQTNSGTLYIALEFQDSGKFSKARPLCDKVRKDVMPVSSKFQLEPTAAKSTHTELLVKEFSIMSILVMLFYQIGKFYRSNPTTILERYTALLQRLRSGTMLPEAEEKEPSAMIKKLTDQLSRYPEKSPTLDQLELDVLNWLRTVKKQTRQRVAAVPHPDKTFLALPAPPQAAGVVDVAATTDHAKLSRRQRRKLQVTGKGGANAAAQLAQYTNPNFQSWDTMWNNLLPPPPLPMHTQYDLGKGGGKGKGAPGGGGATVAAKTGCAPATMIATQRLCIYHLCEMCNIVDEQKGKISCKGKGKCRRDPEHKIATAFYNQHCVKK
eukprot:g12155.t1